MFIKAFIWEMSVKLGNALIIILPSNSAGVSGYPMGRARGTCFHFTSFARHPLGEFPFTHGHSPWNSALRAIRPIRG
jgi:hypothetical protein